MLYPSSFVGTLKNEIPGGALELCQLKLKQFSPEVLKFSTKHEVILLLSTVLWFLALVCLYLMQARVDWVLIIFGTQIIKKKRPVRSVFPDYLSVSYDYGCIIMSRVLFVKMCSYMRKHILLIRHFTIVPRADPHARVDKVSCK